MSRIIIAGGGLAGCLSALALAKRRPDVDFLVIEQGPAFGGKHTWSFFDTDVDPACRWVLEDVPSRHWPKHEVRFPKRARTIGIGYNSISSAGLDAAMRRSLDPSRYRLGQGIAAAGPTWVDLDNGERLEADAVIDARGPKEMPRIDLGWQKFVGRTYRFPKPHRVELPVIMDATVPQRDGYRFVYKLPLSETDLLIEDTYYSVSPTLDRSSLANGLDRTAAEVGDDADLIDEEEGVLPVVIAGEVETLWDLSEPIPFGLRGGFFHPTTGYSLPDAVANAALLAEQRDLSAPALQSLFKDRASRQWRRRGFFQLLNRMLFHGTDPDKAYRVLEHFYRLPAPIIARFYAARLTSFDKLRILSGRPPVPIGRAIAALRRST